MKKQEKNIKLTEKEAIIMKLLWEHGEMTVSEMLGYYEAPKPHFNTVSTTVRILEDKGYVSHKAEGNRFRYFAICRQEDFRDRSLARIIKDYFDNSYKRAVSALVADEKLSVEDLKEIIEMIEGSNQSDNNKVE